nr:synaptobrevin, longin-like domain protein [Tanacetum cinerariifolium]
MARLQFCDYHNMVAILEKSEHNVDFHPIVDFVEASPLRIKTTEEGTKILATVDGILRTVSESSLRRNLKLKDEEGISSLPDAELFENLTLMGYNISPNQKFTFQKGQFSHQWKYLIHTIMQCLNLKSTGFNEFSRNIATALVCLATNRTRNFSKMIFDDEPASPFGDDSQGEACPTNSGFKVDQDRANIAKTSTLRYDLAPKHSEMVAKFEAHELEINSLKARIQVLEDKDRRGAEQYGDDAPIKGRRLDVGEEAAERVSDDTEEMATVLTSMDAVTVLSGGVVKVPTGSGSMPTAGPSAAEVLTGSDVVPTAGPIFATATIVTPYTRRKEVARIHADEELHMMINSLDRSNETILKYLQEYEQFAEDLLIRERVKLINDLIKYQENYAQILKYQTQQRKSWSKKQKRDYYMAVIKSNLGWKVKDFRGMKFEEIEEKFTTVWKQIEDFISMGSKEEAERFKRKGIRFEQESAKKLKTSKKVPEEVKTPDEVSEEKVKEMMQLVPIEKVYVEALQVKHPIIDWKVHTEGQRSYWKITRLGGSSASYQFFMDLLKHLDREDLNQLWALVKESLNIRPAANDEDQLWTHTQNLMHAPVEWKLYDTCGVHHVTSKDREVFMLVEKDYPFKKGLEIVMISYKLQVENYSQMASDLILKIYKIANRPRQEDD